MKNLLRTSYLLVERWLLMKSRSINTSTLTCAGTGRYKDKSKKEQSKVGDDIYRFNQESLVVFGPIKKRLTSSGVLIASVHKQRNRKPLVEKEPIDEYDIEEAERFVGDEPVDFNECLEEEWTGNTRSGTETKHKSFNSYEKKDAAKKDVFKLDSDEVTENSANSKDLLTGNILKSQNKYPDLLDNILTASLLPIENELAIGNSMSQLVGDKRTPNVSTILSDTMPEESRKLLENWKKRKIAEMGLEAFEIEMDGKFMKQLTNIQVVETLY
jgi:hypothetical protein